MPTNISKPRWVCDICRECHEESLAAAERCEAAGSPVTLPDGELHLSYRDHSYHPGFELIVLHPQPRIVTTATRWGTASGHYAVYQLGDKQSGHSAATMDSRWFWPHQPGYLQMPCDPQRQRSRSAGMGLVNSRGGQARGVTAWPLERTGLPLIQEQVDHIGCDHHGGFGAPRLARPITPEVKAVMDLLGAHLDREQWNFYGIGNASAVAAALATSARDGLPAGAYSARRAAWWLTQTDRGPLIKDAEAQQFDWYRGGQVTVPMPHLTSSTRVGGRYSSTKLSPSKLNKTQRAIIAATGVEWPARTSADEYLNLLIRTTLGVTMTAPDPDDGTTEYRDLFGSVNRRYAVTSSKGGVGKTTVAAAIALRFALAGRRVLLIDLNLPNPGQHILFNLGIVKTSPADKLITPTTVYATETGKLAVFSHGQLAPADRFSDALIDISRAGEWISFLAGCLDLRDTDTIVFDLPPGWDAVHRLIFDPYTINLNGSVHVTTGHPLSVATETLPGRDSVGLNHKPAPRLLIENLSRARGPVIGGAEGETAEIRLYGTGTTALQELADREGAVFAGSMPWEPAPADLARTPEMEALADSLILLGAN